QEIQRRSEDLRLAEARETRSGAIVDAIRQAPHDLVRSRADLRKSSEKLKRILEVAAARIEGMSEGRLRARVKEETLPSEFLEAIKDIYENNRIRELPNRCEDKVAEILSDGGLNAWDRWLDQIVTTYRSKVALGDLGQPGESLLKQTESVFMLPGGLTENQVRGIFDRLDDTRVAKVLNAVVRAFIDFEYKDIDGVYIVFEKASPGQQAAALLHLLLRQEAGTLIIDQPEDDLDNREIMSIAHLLQQSKSKRQLLFSTHSPNLVVNGDADKIIALRPGAAEDVDGTTLPRVGIDCDGAIETDSVRRSITSTMEGGEAAFELRARKYAMLP
ncbi:AAA family ATPase, partial [Hypericibacter sp.]|uniref:AAA family ATPase n=1 Tax=Hypericibacter sp. TaxID=2705401 RepID=UPI003D6C76B2